MWKARCTNVAAAEKLGTDHVGACKDWKGITFCSEENRDHCSSLNMEVIEETFKRNTTGHYVVNRLQWGSIGESGKQVSKDFKEMKNLLNA